MLYFDARNLRRRTVLDHRLNLLDVAVALRAVCQHDCRMTFPVDVAGGKERRIQDVDCGAVFVRDPGKAIQFVHRGI